MSADNGFIIHVKNGVVRLEHYFASSDTEPNHTEGIKFTSVEAALKNASEQGSEYGTTICYCGEE